MIKHVLQFANRENYGYMNQGPKCVTISPEAVNLLTIYIFWIRFLHVIQVWWRVGHALPPENENHLLNLIYGEFIAWIFI